jgi:hypothetical protein
MADGGESDSPSEGTEEAAGERLVSSMSELQISEESRRLDRELVTQIVTRVLQEFDYPARPAPVRPVDIIGGLGEVREVRREDLAAARSVAERVLRGHSSSSSPVGRVSRGRVKKVAKGRPTVRTTVATPRYRADDSACERYPTRNQYTGVYAEMLRHRQDRLCRGDMGISFRYYAVDAIGLGLLHGPVSG